MNASATATETTTETATETATETTTATAAPGSRLAMTPGKNGKPEMALKADPSAIKTTDIESAYAYAQAHLFGDDEESLHKYVCEMQRLLQATGYRMAQNVPTFVAAFDKRLTSGKATLPAKISQTAEHLMSAAAHNVGADTAKLSAAIQGNSLANIADAIDAELEDEDSDAKSDTAVSPAAAAGEDSSVTAGGRAAGGKAASGKAAGGKAAGGKAADEPDTSSTDSDEAISADLPAVSVPETVVAPAWMRSLDPANPVLATVNAVMGAASNQAVSSAVAYFNDVADAIDAVALRTRAKAFAEHKLALLKEGNLAAAEAVEVPAPERYTMTRFLGVTFDANQAPGLDVLIGNLVGTSVSVIEAHEMLIQSNDMIKSLDTDLRVANAEIRKILRGNAPSAKSAGQAFADADDHHIVDNPASIVMANASTIFQDAYGASSPILDFEVPTVEFAESNPDVPEVDPTFLFFAPALADALHSLVKGSMMLAFGDAGSGKSEFWIQIAARLGFPLYRANMDSQITRADLIGQHKVIESGNGNPITTFVDGILPRALSQPSLLLIDEFDCMDPEIAPVMQPILEGRGVLILEDGARYVRPHEFSRIGLTGNTNGKGSENMQYLNTKMQSGATLDRIERMVKMPYLPADKEVEVVLSRFPAADKHFVEKMVQLANKIREAYTLNEIDQLCSTRVVQAAASRFVHFSGLYGSEEDAIHSTIEVVLLNRCSENARTVIKGLVDGIF